MNKWMEFWKIGNATRKAYGETLVELGKEDPNIVAIEGDMAHSTYSNLFGKEFPERYFQCGIAEANMVGMGVGMALSGKIPFISTFSSFLLTRTFDQNRILGAYSQVPIKLVGSHGGISGGQDGPTQQAIEDVGLALLLPGYEIIVPCDDLQTRIAVRAIAYRPKPAFIRTGRPPAPIIYEKLEDFEIGKAIQLKDGKDIAIIANGLMVAISLSAANDLESKGISVRVLDMHTVRPLDENAIVSAVKDCGAIIVVEEHLIAGGLGSQIAMFVTEHCPAPVHFIGMTGYAESGAPEDLFVKYNLTAKKVVEKALHVLSIKQ